MKTTFSKVLLMAIVMLLMIGTAWAQETKLSTKEQKQLEKGKKKKEKEEEAKRQYDLTIGLAESQRFVFQATHIGTNEGSESVSPKLNFLIVEGNKMVFQLALGSEIGGWNGIGGATIKGYVDQYKVTPPKKENKPIRVNFKATPEKYNQSTPFVLTLYGDQYADLVIGSYTLRGSIMKPEEAKLFVGSWF